METLAKNTSFEFENMLLSTLSFYEPMTLEKIILDFDLKELQKYPHIEASDLKDILVKLQKAKKIKKIKIKVGKNSEDAWIRIYPTRSWWKRIFV
jgi:hypothetical protein